MSEGFYGGAGSLEGGKHEGEGREGNAIECESLANLRTDTK